MRRLLDIHFLANILSPIHHYGQVWLGCAELRKHYLQFPKCGQGGLHKAACWRTYSTNTKWHHVSRLQFLSVLAQYHSSSFSQTPTSKNDCSDQDPKPRFQRPNGRRLSLPRKLNGNRGSGNHQSIPGRNAPSKRACSLGENVLKAHPRRKGEIEAGKDCDTGSPFRWVDGHALARFLPK
jgi:hypothetical protein